MVQEKIVTRFQILDNLYEYRNLKEEQKESSIKSNRNN